jgi:hypothetical protein
MEKMVPLVDQSLQYLRSSKSTIMLPWTRSFQGLLPNLRVSCKKRADSKPVYSFSKDQFNSLRFQIDVRLPISSVALQCGPSQNHPIGLDINGNSHVCILILVIRELMSRELIWQESWLHIFQKSGSSGQGTLKF